jgi:integrase
MAGIINMHKNGRDRQRLTALDVRRLRKPGRYGDGLGLYLAVSESGAKSWIFLWSRHGKRRAIGLGSAATTSLADARNMAAEKRQAVHSALREGRTPLGARAERAGGAGRMTFGAMADQLFESLAPSWKNAKHRYQWERTLQVHCKPLRDKRVAEITTNDVLFVLKPLWDAKQWETALRTRARIERVLDYAKGKGHRAGENAAVWKGNLQALLPAPPAKRKRVQHLPALPFAEVPAFIGEIRELSGIAPKALEFAVLTAARTGEVLHAKWSEIDLANRVWTVPPERMKTGVRHRVPLPARAMAILREMKKVRASEFVFPGFRDEQPLSDVALLAVLRRRDLDVVTHGFRSSFKDWAAERTDFANEVSEAALAHVIENEVEAAYRRSDLFNKRRELMTAWANYCECKAGDVVQLRRSRAP